MYSYQQSLDRVVWEENAREQQRLYPSMYQAAHIREIEELAERKFNKTAKFIPPPSNGSFNILY